MCDHIINSNKEIAGAVAELVELCPLMRAAYERAGLPPLRRNENSFASLARIITGQLLSVASASAIWGRLAALVRPFDPSILLSLSQADLKKAGLSNAKIGTLKGLASMIESGEIDLKAFETQPKKQVRMSLTSVKGIGPWTADIYIMFCLGHRDGFAAGDVALANAV